MCLKLIQLYMKHFSIIFLITMSTPLQTDYWVVSSNLRRRLEESEIPEGLQWEDDRSVFTRILFAQVHFSEILFGVTCPSSSQLRHGRRPSRRFIEPLR